MSDTMRDELTQQRLKELLSYDAETGVFTWIVKRQGTSSTKIAGNVNASGYVVITISGKTYRAHRLAWLYAYGEWPAKEIDHKDRVKTNNALRNLRAASRSENAQNMLAYSRSATGIRGVTWCNRERKWVAVIIREGNRTNLGYHRTIESAVAARKAAEVRLFGEFAP